MRRLAPRAATALLALLMLVSGSREARAGGYFSPSLKWDAFSAEPEAKEATTNFYGVGGSVQLGYSLRQAVDFGGFASYLPGRAGMTDFAKSDASLVSYGGELGLRLGDTVYVGFKGGGSVYQLLKKDVEDAVPGVWGGPCGGLALGAVNRLSKTGFLQTTLEMMHYVMTNKKNGDEDTITGRRRFDSFALSFAFVHNGNSGSVGSAVENSIFRNFLDSIVFF